MTNLEEVESIVKGMSLRSIRSEFGFAESPMVFANRSPRIFSTEDKWDTTYLYVGHDEATLYQLLVADLAMDHETVGLILNYPTCCIDFFVRNKQLALDQFGDDYSAISAAATYGRCGFWQTNTFQRPNGAGLISHFVCSFQCIQSLRIGQSRHRCLKDCQPSLTLNLVSMLLQPITISNANSSIMRMNSFQRSDLTLHAPIRDKTIVWI